MPWMLLSTSLSLFVSLFPAFVRSSAMGRLICSGLDGCVGTTSSPPLAYRSWRLYQ